MYSFWRSGEPNNQVNSSQQTGGEDFGEMQGNQGGRWNDIPSYGSDYYVCEFSPNTSSCSGVVEVVVTCLEGSPDGFCGSGTQWDAISQTCIVTNPSDTDFDGCVSMTDLLDLLTVFGTCAEEELEEDPEVTEWSCGDPLEYQGYDYETVQIGEQCWFAENLRAEKYRNGDDVPFGANSVEGSVNPKYRTVFDLDPSVEESNGFLYSWFAADDNRGLCPNNWHVPSIAEFDLLLYEVGGIGIAGTQLKAQPPTWNGEDNWGFTATPSGIYNLSPGEFYFFNTYGYLWSSTGVNDEEAWYLLLWEENAHVTTSPGQGNRAEDAMSIRCLKDSE